MSTEQTVRFQLGQIVATPGALEAFLRNHTTGLDYLKRHASGDWGVVSKDDKESNDEAVQTGDRILSAYLLSDETKIWVITDAAIDDDGKRLVTTFLLPDEY